MASHLSPFGFLGFLALSLGACLEVPPPAHEQAEQGPRMRVDADTPKGPSLRAQVGQPVETPKPRPGGDGDGESDGDEIVPGELAVVADHFPAPARLVAIGDLHGDLEVTKAALRLAGAIDGSERWIGGSLVIVQTGDQLDRGEGEQEILELLARVQRQAAAAGGALHILNGNHEFMNALGDLRYVTPGGFADFEDAPGVDPDDPALGTVMAEVPERARARVAAFFPGQPWARELAKRNTIVVVGDSVFVHGGVLPTYAEDIGAVNREARAFLAGERAEPPEAIVDPDGPVWSRHYSNEPDADDCALLEATLATLGAERMVVGHTVHTEGIQSACGDRIWMIDVGMADYYDGPLQVLEIRGGEVAVLRAK